MLYTFYYFIFTIQILNEYNPGFIRQKRVNSDMLEKWDVKTVSTDVFHWQFVIRFEKNHDFCVKIRNSGGILKSPF